MLDGILEQKPESRLKKYLWGTPAGEPAVL